MKSVAYRISRRWVGTAVATAVGIALALVPDLRSSQDVVGLEQSPIDIESELVQDAGEDGLPAINFRYPTRVNLSVVNTGSPEVEATIRADVPAGAASLRINGVTYDLLQFHFHTPGEHELDGRQFPMELHLVHRKRGSTGLQDLLVVGRWLTLSRRPGRELARIFADLPQHHGDTVVVTGFNLNRLLPDDFETYRYPGSLTTAPYAEGVKWNVFLDPLAVSAGQVAAFEGLFPEGNSRETQPLGSRVVVSDREPEN